ncbi:hypothetical protein DFH06DRAFT_1137206 [Mycena polygramma]|nr:hypothetical protein DFH06DRAFT_1137206 [Mycena polygramma]
MPPGVPDDCPVILVDGVLEVLPFGDQGTEDDSVTPRSLSEIEQDESDSSDADSSSAVQSHEDAAAAADTLAALADLPSPQLAPSLLPSPDLPSPTYNAHAHTANLALTVKWDPLRDDSKEARQIAGTTKNTNTCCRTHGLTLNRKAPPERVKKRPDREKH